MDRIDKRLLNLLQDDASRTNAELADLVGLSPSSCLRRIRRLKDAGIIDRVVALLSPAKAGRGLKAIVTIELERHGEQYMLWDTGVSGGLVGHPSTNPVMTLSLRSRIVDQLARINVRPDQVAIVGISHHHGDHTGQARDFPGARLLMGAGDLAALRARPAEAQADLARWLTGGGQVTEVPGDLDVFGDGSVTMLNLPGHTPGHHGLLIRLASGPVMLSGDLYHFTEQVANRGVPPFNTDRAASLASMDRFDRLARNLHARVIIQHEPADVARLPAFPEAAH